MSADVFIPTNTKGLCGRCGKTRGMHHFVSDDNDPVDGTGDPKITAYCTPTKKGDASVVGDLEALWEPTPSQCSSCGHTTGNGGLYFYKVNDKYRYCIWCSSRGGRGNVMRLILVRALADRDCENPNALDLDELPCGKCLPCLARKWGDHPFV